MGRHTSDNHRFDPSLWWLVDDGDELAAISLNAWHFSGDPQFGWIHVLGVRPAWRRRGLATALLLHSFRDFKQRGATRVGLGVDGENTTGAVRLYETRRHAPGSPRRHLREDVVSRLRARCPDCRTFTAVAIGPGYECHSCGREYGAGMVRVPAGLGRGRRVDGRSRAAAAAFPEAAVVEEETLDEQTLAVAIDLPERPVVLGGCCCAHIGAVEALAARNGRIALVWLDAHGDLNTPESSPSGNLWGMPLRMILDSGAVDPADTILLGARSLDPPERESSPRSACAPRPMSSSTRSRAPRARTWRSTSTRSSGEIHPFMPEPGGLTLAEVEELLLQVRERAPVLGAGFSGLAAEPENVEPLDAPGARSGAVTPGPASGLNSQLRVRTDRRLH